MAVSVGQVAAGIDPATGLAHPVKVDANGNISIIGGGVGNSVFGTGTVGIAPPQAPVNVGGVDAGGLLRNVLLDATGAQVAVGKGANGAAVSGNPVLIAGSDGANTRSFKTDVNGALNVLGTVPSNTVAAPNPVAIAGHDGARVQYIHTDPSGNIYTVAAAGSGGIVFGPSNNGAAPAQPPVLSAGWDGVNTRTLLTDSGGSLNTVPGNTINTYSSYLANTVIGPNPIFFQLQGSATKKVRLRYLSVQLASGANTFYLLSIMKCSAPSTGGTISPAAILKSDPANPNPTAITTAYTVGATPGALIGQFDIGYVQAGVVANTIGPTHTYQPPPGAQAIALVGVNEYFQLYINVLPSSTIGINIVWTEE